MLSFSIFEPNLQNPLSIITIVLGGLGLFLYGIDLMSDSLKNLSGSKMKILVEKTTNSLFKGLLTGLLVTLLIQSSSATTVIVIGLISAGLMTLKQSIGVMMGANIGTTITSFLIGLKISEYSFLFTAVGSIMLLFIASRKIKLTGGIILGFGILFIGLELMNVGLIPLKDQAWFNSTMTSMSKYPILGVLAGTGLTTLIQSSSASIGVLQQIFGSGAIELNAAIPILLGCNIGTTITAIIASLKATPEAKQASVFHLLFNVFGTIIFMIFLKYYTNLFELLETKFFGEYNQLTIAFAHIGFNAITTIIVLFLVKYFIVIIEKLIPAKKDDTLLLVDKLNVELIESSPVLALQSAKTVMLEMGQIALNMINIARKYQNDDNIDYFNSINELEDKIDYYDHKIHDYLMEFHTHNLHEKEIQLQMTMLDTLRDFERIADHAVNLSEFYRNRYELNCPFTGITKENLDHYFDLIIKQVNDAFMCFKTYDKKIAKAIITLEAEIDILEKQYRRNQLINKNETHSFCNDIHYVDILANLERISDHCNNIAENIIDPHYMSKERTIPLN